MGSEFEHKKKRDAFPVILLLLLFFFLFTGKLVGNLARDTSYAHMWILILSFMKTKQKIIQ